MKLEWRQEPRDLIMPGAKLLIVENTSGNEPCDPMSDEAQLLVMRCAGPAARTLLTNLYVPVAWRGRGIGRQMMRYALEEMCPIFTPVYLLAVPFGAEAMPEEQLREWYAAMGFAEVEGHEFLMWLPGPEMAALFDGE